MKLKKLFIVAPLLTALSFAGCGNEQSSSVPDDSSVSTTEPMETTEPTEASENLSINFPEEGNPVSTFCVYMDEIEVTSEMNEKICGLMQDVHYVGEELELAIMEYATVRFGDGSVLSIDENPSNFAGYYNAEEGKFSIVTVPGELKSYVLELAYEWENEPADATEAEEGLSINFPDEGNPVSVFRVYSDEITVTPEMNEKICGLMQDVYYVREEQDLAIWQYASVEFSDGSILSVDRNSTDYGSYYNAAEDKSGLVTLPQELKEYILDIAALSKEESENN